MFLSRKQTGLVVNGMSALSSSWCGSCSLPIEPRSEMHWHLGTLALIPDHCNQSETLASRMQES